MNNSNLMDSFMLIAINQKNDRLYTSGTYLKYGLSGIAILLLAEMSKLSINEKSITVIDTTSTGDELLDEVFKVITSKSTTVKLYTAIHKISYKVNRFEKRVLERLEDNGIIRIDQEKLLGIFPYRKYVVTNSTQKERIVNDLRKVLLEGNKKPELESAILISIAAVCGILYRLFSKDERKSVYKIIKQVKKGTYFELDNETLYQVTKAVNNAVTSSQTAAVT